MFQRHSEKLHMAAARTTLWRQHFSPSCGRSESTSREKSCMWLQRECYFSDVHGVDVASFQIGCGSSKGGDTFSNK